MLKLGIGTVRAHKRTPSVLGAEGVRFLGRRVRARWGWVRELWNSKSRSESCCHPHIVKVQSLSEGRDSEHKSKGQKRQQDPVFGGSCPPLVFKRSLQAGDNALGVDG